MRWPAKPESATPWPEKPEALSMLGATRETKGRRDMVMPSVPPQTWSMRTPFSCGKSVSIRWRSAVAMSVGKAERVAFAAAEEEAAVLA
jgi:hypothetical protein